MAEPLSLGQLGRVLLRYWILIVAGTLLGAVLAFGATRLMTPVYRATATQLVKGQPGTGSTANYEAAQYAVSRAKTYPPFVYNAGVLKSVQEDLSSTRTVDQLRSDLVASNPVGTPLLEITAAGTTPREASEKANSAARHLALFITKIESVNGKSPISVELAVQAALPTEAASPKTLVITALGALVGFALATIVALLNSYIRFQRRLAFRRRQAVSLGTEKPESTRAARKRVRPVTPGAGASDGIDSVDEVATDPGPGAAASVGYAPGELVGEASAASVSENQPALVEPHDVETVITAVETKVTTNRMDRPVAEAPAAEPELAEDDLYPTIRVSALGPFLDLAGWDRPGLDDVASASARPAPDPGLGAGSNGAGFGSSSAAESPPVASPPEAATSDLDEFLVEDDEYPTIRISDLGLFLADQPAPDGVVDSDQRSVGGVAEGDRPAADAVVDSDQPSVEEVDRPTADAMADAGSPATAVTDDDQSNIEADQPTAVAEADEPTVVMAAHPDQNGMRPQKAGTPAPTADASPEAAPDADELEPDETTAAAASNGVGEPAVREPLSR